MGKYQIVFHWTDGTDEVDDNDGAYYDSEEEAEETALYYLSCCKQGAETLEMSNPGDYPYNEEDFEDDEFDVEEVD
ncbi:MAG: hypothetical protein IKX20_04625 [Paludibacteraceae bacterium]|nr:hypothetical protein [Paludibacteraceae bacterium]